MFIKNIVKQYLTESRCKDMDFFSNIQIFLRFLTDNSLFRSQPSNTIAKWFCFLNAFRLWCCLVLFVLTSARHNDKIFNNVISRTHRTYLNIAYSFPMMKNRHSPPYRVSRCCNNDNCSASCNMLEMYVILYKYNVISKIINTYFEFISLNACSTNSFS